MRRQGSEVLILALLLALTPHCSSRGSSVGEASGDSANTDSANTDSANSDSANSDSANSDSANSVGNVADKEAFMDALVGVTCNLNSRCPDSLVGRGSLTGAECEAEQRANLQSQQVLTDEQVLYDAENGRDCLEAFNAVDCMYGFLTDLETACGAVFYGAGAANSSCTIDEHCEVGLYCNESVSCPGTCQPRPQQGQACPDYECATGLSCIESSIDTEARCETRGAAGVACGRELRDCQPGLLCDDTELCTPLTQALPPASLGETCRDTIQCTSDQFCTASWEVESGVCSMRLNAGAACEITAACAPGLFCQALLSGEGSCTAQSPLGAVCDQDEFYECATGECFDGSCGLQGAIGATCSTDEACHSYYCASGVCAMLPACE